MAGPEYARRKDGNHAACREEYRRLGCFVKDINFVGDLFVIVPCGALCKCHGFYGIYCNEAVRLWVEVKKDAKEKLTDNEKEWQLLLGPQHVIVRSLDDVRASVENARK